MRREGEKPDLYGAWMRNASVMFGPVRGGRILGIDGTGVLYFRIRFACIAHGISFAGALTVFCVR